MIRAASLRALRRSAANTFRRISVFGRRLARIRDPGAAEAMLAHIVALAAAEPDATAPADLLISLIVPVYDTDQSYLDQLAASVRRQRPGICQVIFSDDGSTRSETRRWLEQEAARGEFDVILSPVNAGIAAATNRGLTAARAPWVGLLDHDDALSPFALDRVAKAIEGSPDCQFLYTDEVITDSALRPVDFFFKPGFDPVMLSGVNYVNHLSIYRRERLSALGGLREGFDGSQDYDLVLRYTKQLEDRQIVHVPYPAYQWRRDGRSYSAVNGDRARLAARRALAEAYDSEGAPARVDETRDGGLHRVRFDTRAKWPSVTAIVPNRDSYELMERVADGLARTDYPDLEIVVVDNGSTDPGVLALYDRLRAGPRPFQAWIEDRPFNFARAINEGAAKASGELLLFLNNDVELPDPQWLKEMASCFAYGGVGVVGAKLLYPDRTLQHAGVIVGFGGLAGHWFLGHDEAFPGPMGRLWVRQSFSAVTGACLLTSRAAYEAIGLMDESAFAVAYNDVDYCLRARAAGLRVLWTPFAACIHHESATRGSDETPQNESRFLREKRNLRERHRTDTYEDAAASPWFTKDRSTPGWRRLERLPDPR